MKLTKRAKFRKTSFLLLKSSQKQDIVVLKLVILYYPELLLSTFNICLKKGKFHNDWKKQKLVLLRKGDKPLNRVSSYRPLLDTMGKLLEGLILQRLETHMEGENGMSNRQYGFRKG